MNFRRVLLPCNLGTDVSDTIAKIRQLAPAAELLLVVAGLPARSFAWFVREAPDEQNEAATKSLDQLRELARGAATEVDVRLTPELTTDALDELALDAGIDLIAAGSLSFAQVGVLAELRKRRFLALFWHGQNNTGHGPLRQITCSAVGSRGVAAVATFLRDHADATMRARVVMLEEHIPYDREWLDIAGIEADVEFVRLSDMAMHVWNEDQRAPAPDLIVLPRFPGALLTATDWPAPLLVLPPLPPSTPALRRAIDAADVVDDAGMIRARFEFATGIGLREPIPDQQLALVADGRIAAFIETRGGRAELPARLRADSFGVYRTSTNIEHEPLAAIELAIVVLEPGTRPLVLFDGGLDGEDLEQLIGAKADVDLVAVRMRATESCRAIRSRLRKRDLPPRVVDASAVIDEGDALDVPDLVDSVRLVRVAARLRAAGFPVAAIVHDGRHTPLTIGFPALRASEVAAMPWEMPPRETKRGSLDTRLERTTGTTLLAGNHIEVELDNALARRWLIDGIAAARNTIHLQVYMGVDDDVGSAVEAALAASGARGVAIRVLVDSLHALHGSLGTTNPLFERLGKRPGVDLRLLSPITGAPSLEELKQRDHRKLVIIDGATALIGGRNLSHEYYTGFDEVNLSPQSLWREVPWLDGGARIEGPAVTALEHSFLETWTAAGGAAYEVIASPPRGTSAARVVIHQGLRDAFTLEAYLAMIETARSHVYAVNGFPLILEIQNALLHALRRGVRVCTLFGNLTPTHGGKPFEGPWATARLAATELVHSRMDTLVAAGAEGYRFAVPQQPSWSPGLGPISPHVHAKVMSADGRACAIGSANLDITAGYWESELLLVVEDPQIATSLEARIETLLRSSERVDRADARWQESARRRSWMRHWPGVLSV